MHHRHVRERGADSPRRIFWALCLTAGFMVVEVIGGIVAGSLALLADAGHMLTDTAALALAWLAFRVARRPADTRRTFGYHRFQVLAAFVNGISLFAITGWILFEAAQRLLEPQPVLGGTMLAVAAAGLAVNLIAFALLRGGDRDNLNVRGAALHVFGDLLGSLTAIVAALVIVLTGWTPIDPLLSVLVALLIVRSAWLLVRRSGHILLEGAPEWLDVEALRAELHREIPAVEDIHHVHVWSLAPDRQLLTLHVHVRSGSDASVVLSRIKVLLAERYGITHSTIQLDPERCADH